MESILCPSGQKGCLPQRQPSLKDGQEKMARSPRAIEAAVSWALSTAACNCDRERLLWIAGVARLQVAGLSCKLRLPLHASLIEAVVWLAVACHRSCLLVCSELLSRATAKNYTLRRSLTACSGVALSALPNGVSDILFCGRALVGLD